MFRAWGIGRRILLVFLFLIAALWIRSCFVGDYIWISWGSEGRTVRISHSVPGALYIYYYKLDAGEAFAWSREPTGWRGFGISAQFMMEPRDLLRRNTLPATLDLQIPYSVPVAVGMLVLWLPVRKRLDRWARRACPNCGYDVRSSPDRCPECGTASR